MITLAAIAWFYLSVRDGDTPYIGPMTKQDCVALKGIRARTGYDPGVCIPAGPQR